MGQVETEKKSNVADTERFRRFALLQVDGLFQVHCVLRLFQVHWVLGLFQVHWVLGLFQVHWVLGLIQL